MNTKKALSVGVLAALTSTGVLVQAQPKPLKAPAPTPTLAPRVATLPVQLAPITVDPQLKPLLAQKTKFDPSRLGPKLSVQGGRTLLQIANGRKYLLEPVGAEPVPSPSLQITQLPPQLSGYAQHVEAPIVSGRRIVVKLPDILLDHVNTQTGIRDQGSRGTCTAFASMAGLEAWAKRKRATTLDLSENHAFQLFMAEADSACTTNGGYTTWKTGPVLTSQGVCAESSMPYNGSACPSSVPATCRAAAPYRLGASAHFFSPKYGGTGSLRADNTNLLEAWLKAGYDIVYGVDVAGSDWSDGSLSTGVVDVQVDGNGDPVGGYGGHAMLLVGYNRAARYFIFKNSWGTDSGHDGYVHLTYDYVQTYGKYGYAVLDVNGPAL